eukprot:TRINITY_DN42485_c0_g1_i1.p1 TRINITY_DN42485_c0_g1~~TRINITY_DN42485_c0_g1_i1.p1  ORF type:complete len:808 (-),score=132.94 TRINITY_DN42485_c0_g1_i1:3-2063(-)
MFMREDRLMCVIAAESVKMVKSFDHRQLATTVWGFAKAGLWNEDLAKCLAFECKQKIDTFTPHSLSHVSCAMALWSYKEEELLDKIAAEVMRRCDEFKPGALAMTAWAFSNLMIRNESLMTAIAEASCQKIPRFRREDLAHLAWAFANLKIQDRALFGLMANEVVIAGAKYMEAPELANMAWAFSKNHVANPSIMKILAEEAALKINDFKSSELTMMTWAYAEVSQQHPSMMTQVGDIVVRSADRFTHAQLAHITWAFGALAMRHMGLMELVAKSSQARPDRFNGHGLVHIAWSFAKVNYSDKEFFNAVAPIIVNDISYMKPLTLCRCAWAYTTFAFDSTVIEAVMDESCLKINDFSTRDLMKLVDRSLTASKSMSAYHRLQKYMDDKCDEIVQMLASCYLQGPGASGYVENCDRLRQLVVGITDFGLTATPRILSKLDFQMPGFDAMMRARRTIAKHNIFDKLKSKTARLQRSRQCFMTADVDVETQARPRQEIFTIEWSEHWLGVLQDHMKGMHDETFVIYDSMNVVIDPCITQPDRATFPLRLTRFTISRHRVRDVFVGCSGNADLYNLGRLDFFCSECQKSKRDPRLVEQVTSWKLFAGHSDEPVTHALHHILAEVCTLLNVGRDSDRNSEAIQGRIVIVMSALPPLGSIIILLQLRSYLPNVKVEFVEMQAFPHDARTGVY